MRFYYQKWIERSDLQNNPDTIFLFGDNVKRVGLGGQAKAMRGEPNALGIATKWSPSSTPSAFFSDKDYDEITSIIYKDMIKAFTFRVVGKSFVIPADGLGTGLSKLPERAPAVNGYLLRMLERLTTFERIKS